MGQHWLTRGAAHLACAVDGSSCSWPGHHSWLGLVEALDLAEPLDLVEQFIAGDIQRGDGSPFMKVFSG